jgi:hypothetical protein
MKKTLITVLAIAMFVALFGVVGSAYAMEDAGKGPGNGGNGGGAAGTGSASSLSVYMNEAIASVLGLDPADYAARLDAGETFYTIALAQGYSQEELADLFASAQAAAVELAAADGIIVYQNQNGNAGQSRIYDGTCDGTGDCLQINPAASLYTGANAGMRGRRGGR